MPDPIDYVFHESFDSPNAVSEILGSEPSTKKSYKSNPSNALPKYLRDLYAIPLLSKVQEQHLFRKMNFLLYLANRMDKIIIECGSEHKFYKFLKQISKDLFDEAAEIKNRVIKANLRLVISIAKKKRNRWMTLDDLISDGNISLICAVNRFDFSRGFKFSTYASKSIMKNYSRTIPDSKKVHDRFTPGHNVMLDRIVNNRTHEIIPIRNQNRAKETVNRILEPLSERTREIFARRFGFNGHLSHTLEELGNKFGITKERIRQILNKEMTKIRESGIIRESDLTYQKD